MDNFSTSRHRKVIDSLSLLSVVKNCLSLPKTMLVVKAGATMVTQDLAAAVTLTVAATPTAVETPTEAEATLATEEEAVEASKIVAEEVAVNVVVAVATKAVVMTTKAVRTTTAAAGVTITTTMVATGDPAPHPATQIVVPKVELPNTLVIEAVVLVAVVPEAVVTLATPVRSPALTQLLLTSQTMAFQEAVSQAVLPSTRKSNLRVSPTQFL